MIYAIFLLKRLSSIECQDPLGMENGLILDTQISASSYWSAKYAPSKSRLHNAGPCWVSSKVDTNQWLQIDVLGTNGRYTKVTRIATQGRANEASKQWVTEYKVQYSNDGLRFTNYSEKGRTTDKVSPFKCVCVVVGSLLKVNVNQYLLIAIIIAITTCF